MTWHRAATVADLEGRGVLGIEIGEAQVALYHVDGTYYATHNICTHQHAFMSDGYLDKACIECPLHQALFDVRTGEVLDGPASEPLATYPVKVEGDEIFVDLPAR